MPIQPIGKIFVPSDGNPESKLWFIGEAPGEEEEKYKKPFVGQSGEKLNQVLSACGVSRENVYVTNLSPYRPHGNKFEHLRDTEILRDSIENLQSRIVKYKPNCIALLGANPLEYIAGKQNINYYRGSVLPYIKDGLYICKVIPTYHPAYILRVPEKYPIFQQDIRRICGDSKYPDLRYKERRYIIDPDPATLVEYVDQIYRKGMVTVDIESYKGSGEKINIVCVGFGISDTLAICLPWNSHNAFHIKNILEESKIKKIFHFGAFDTEVFYLNGINTRGYHFDTIVSQHVLEPELPRGLGFLTSIYTREPYYKKEGRGEIPDDTKVWSAKTNKKDLYIYNCKDVCVTYEIYQAQSAELAQRKLTEYFDYKMSLLPVAQEIGRNGMLLDKELLPIFRDALQKRIDTYQYCLENLAGIRVNVNSPKQLCDLLYTKIGLPVRTKDHNRTSDEDALISLLGYCENKLGILKNAKSQEKWSTKKEIVHCIMKLKALKKKRSSYIDMDISEDNRVRSTYDVTGTDTTRWSCSKYVDGTGLNAQTLPRDEITI
jgi:uracil-DNA glycosylase family 4